MCPIPGDNGDPQGERDKQNQRIKEVAEHDACVKKEVNFNKPRPKEKNIFGVM